MTAGREESRPEAVAIVGMAGRFPGAASVAQLWENLKAGKESISALSDEELLASGIDASRLADPLYVKARGVLEDVDLFDAPFFGFTPREAALTDPQHRLFLETCYRALEDAGCNPETFAGGIGVFGGMSMNTYLLSARGRDSAFWKELTESYQIGGYPSVLGNDYNFLATRVSYKLDLKGPSLDVQTGCSTSLVAVCLACRALLQHDCDAALAGGVSITFPQKRGYLYQEGAMGSRDGRCRAFDAAADGTVFGSGVAVVVLKRLSDALADGDSIVAVIRGFALNNDGSAKVGYMAPSVEGQAEVIATAQAVADVDAESIGYVETHGTGTPLGDPIEIAGLTRAFRSATAAKGFCAIGSVKPNVGHLDIASGVTGLIKAALAVRTGLIPPSLHFESPNPAIDFANSPFFVNTRLSAWKRSAGPRRAGVSAFGVGGTNAHLVLEEAPAPAAPAARPCELLVLSARTPTALDAAAANLARHLAENPETDLGNVAFTLQNGRKPFAHRRAIVCASAADAATSLAGALRREAVDGGDRRADSVAFLFPGQGSQSPGMARETYESEERFRTEVDRCCGLLGPELGAKLLGLLLTAPKEGDAPEKSPIHRTGMAQPALFVVEYALARLWESWGIRPVAMLGHSLGEFVAATLAGVFSLEDALALVAARGRLIEALPGGSMLAVRIAEEQLAPLARPGLSLAAVNTPSLCVLSGAPEVIEGLEIELSEQGLVHRRLQTSHAFHSEMMDPVLAPFEDLVRSVRLRPPSIPFASSVTGTWIRTEEAVDPAYWSAHMRRTVRFARAVGELLSEEKRALLEVGPGQALSLNVRRHPGKTPRHVVLSSLSHPEDRESDRACLLRSVGQLWTAGLQIDWMALQAGRGLRRISLPTYPFERTRHWIDDRRESAASSAIADEAREFEPPPAPSRGTDAPPGKTEVKTMNENLAAAASRHPRLLSRVQHVFADLSGLPPEQMSPSATFLEIGFDSLLLTQASQHLFKEFGIRIAFRELMGDASTPDLLASYLDSRLPPDVVAAAPSSPPAATAPRATPSAPAVGTATAPASPGLLERLVTEQLRVMTQQLAMLRNEAPVDLPSAAAPPLPAPTPERGLPAAPTQAPAPGEKPAFKPFGPYKPIDKGSDGALTADQRRYLAGFIERYSRRTAKSKRLAEEHRSHFADPRVVAGFRLDWKEIVYPIVATGSSGSRVFDVDGNTYVDMLMGFGLNLFGHSPSFVTEAVAEQLRKGVEIGPQSPLAGEVARLISEFTGMERVTFCNTGSEAVMAAIRLARTVTGRDTVALFSGAYHGTFDEVLVRGVRTAGGHKSLPIAPGIPSSHVQDVLVLDYGTDESLRTLESRMGELAAVLVEPVQSRHPDLQPGEFLRELRKMTEKAGTALIFDEVITGFRVHPGGAQALFGIAADIATYGKVLGGGLPLGVVAGKRAFMDALDGGTWRFGDASFPETGVTFFAGTFVRHPLAMAAARAVLHRLKEAGPALQEGLNAKAKRLATRINACFETYRVPSKVENFGSILFFGFPSDQRLASLLFYHLRDHGVHIWEGFPCFVTEAHTEEDLDFVVRAFEASAAEMRSGGLLPGAGEDAPRADPVVLPPAATTTPVSATATPAAFPLTDAQREIWLACQMGAQASCAFNEGVSVRLRGPLDVAALTRSLDDLVARHDALRTTFDRTGDLQRVGGDAAMKVEIVDVAAERPVDGEARLRQILLEEASVPFDLEHGPLLRARLVRLAAEHHVLVLTAHHLASDGWSTNVLLNELASLYSSRRDGAPGLAEPAARFSDFAAREQARRRSPEAAPTEAYWLAEFASPPPPLDLPTDRPRPAVKTYSGSTVRRTISAESFRRIRSAGAKEGCTLFTTLFAAFAALLHRLTGQDDLVVGIPAAGQAMDAADDLVGHCVNFLSIRSHAPRQIEVREYLRAVRKKILDAYEHQDSTYGRLIQKLALPRDPSRLPLVEAQFNLERLGAGSHWEGLQIDVDTNPKSFVNDDLFLNVVETPDGLVLDCDFNTDLFDAATVERWLEYFENLLDGIAEDPARPLSALPLASAAERERVLVEWNQTRRRHSRAAGAHQLVEAQVVRSPGAIAVSFRDQRLSYADLNARANQLAHRLASLGVAPGSLVGLCLGRSLELPVALLAVLKAGGAYVPLDPSHPPGARRGDPGGRGSHAPDRQRKLRSSRGRTDPRPRRRARRDRARELREPADPDVGERPRLRHVHVGIHGEAEGRRGRPSLAREPARGDAGAPGTGPRGHAPGRHDDLLRHRDTGSPLAVDGWGPNGSGRAGGRGRRCPTGRGAVPLPGDGAPGDADDLEAPDRLGLERPVEPEDALRRRAPRPRPGRRSAGAGRIAVEHVWSHRDDDLVGRWPDRRRREHAPDRTTDRQHPVLRPRRRPPAGSDRRAGRGVHRGRGPGPRVLEPAGSDRTKLRSRSLPWRERRAPLPHRRCRPVPAGREDRAPRPTRSAGQTARTSDRARRSRIRSREPPFGARSRHDRPRRLARGKPARRLRRPQNGGERLRRPRRAVAGRDDRAMAGTVRFGDPGARHARRLRRRPVPQPLWLGRHRKRHRGARGLAHADCGGDSVLGSPPDSRDRMRHGPPRRAAGPGLPALHGHRSVPGGAGQSPGSPDVIGRAAQTVSNSCAGSRTTSTGSSPHRSTPSSSTRSSSTYRAWSPCCGFSTERCGPSRRAGGSSSATFRACRCGRRSTRRLRSLMLPTRCLPPSCANACATPCPRETAFSSTPTSSGRSGTATRRSAGSRSAFPADATRAKPRVSMRTPTMTLSSIWRASSRTKPSRSPATGKGMAPGCRPSRLGSRPPRTPCFFGECPFSGSSPRPGRSSCSRPWTPRRPSASCAVNWRARPASTPKPGVTSPTVSTTPWTGSGPIRGGTGAEIFSSAVAPRGAEGAGRPACRKTSRGRSPGPSMQTVRPARPERDGSCR